MQVLDEALDGVVLMAPTVFADERGSFFESFNELRFQEIVGNREVFVQDNHSTSARSVVRGIHYQLPHPQGKLVRVVEGEVWDVAIDLRRSSSTFLEWRGYSLSAANANQLWIPEGFGHGFIAISDNAQVLYKTTEYWHQADDRSLRWNDPSIGIDWPLVGSPQLSEKDQAAPFLEDAVVFE